MEIPSGELTFCYGKSPFLMGKSTISTGPFSIAFCMFTKPGSPQFETGVGDPPCSETSF